MEQVEINDIEEAGLKILKDATKRIIEENAADVAVLGVNAAKAIVMIKIIDRMPPLERLGPDATIEQIKERELIIQKREVIVQLAALAFKQDAARVARIRESAGNILGTVVKSAFSVAIGLALKAVIGI